MPYAFLALAALGVLAVALTYRPLRKEPFTVVSFVVGWLVGELPLQTIALQVAVTVVFGLYGAFGAWPGDVGLGLAVLGWAGMAGLAVTGARAREVVAAALADPRAGSLDPARIPDHALWARWWRVARAIPLRSRRVQIERDVDYWGDGIRRHRLDIVKATGTTGGAPVLVYIHGGAWVMGEKREQGRPMLYELAMRGWVGVAVNYRLSPRATWPDHIVDCKRAIAWVREHIAEHGGDPSFVVVSGGSAGGHLCALAALTAGDPAWQPGFETADTSVDACVPFYGVMDMTGAQQGSGKYGPGLLELLEKRVMKTSSAEHPEVFEQASPTSRVHPGAPPFFVLHGTNDTLVPVEVARQFVSELRAVSQAPVAYAELPLAQHAFDVLSSMRCRATTAGVVAFLEAVRERRRPRPSDLT
ncbi:MAG: alpha/beta hydrolase [Actinomycetota bacterium]|nr:alpha/beta hydrolase [Actinomycetota bacterium]